MNPKRLWTALDHALLHTTTRKSLQPFIRGKKKKGNSKTVSCRSTINYIMPHELFCNFYEPNYSDEYQHDIPDTITPIDTHEGPGGLPVQILNAHVKPTASMIQRKCSMICLIIDTISYYCFWCLLHCVYAIFIAQNQAEAGKNNELNLHDHPIMHLHPDKKDDDFGRIVPMDIAQGFGKDDKDVRR